MTKQFPLTARHLDKCNQPTCYKVEFTPEGIANLRRHYHEVRGLPGFLDDCLNLNPDAPQMRVLLKHPELMAWNNDGTAVTLPNGSYFKPNHLQANPHEFKNLGEGLSTITWFIHPKQLEQTIFGRPEMRQNLALAAKSVVYDPKLEPHTRTHRYEYQKRIRDLEDNSGIPYLTSVLDLKPEHVPWLKEVKARMLDQLRTQYGITDTDHVSLFVHRVSMEEYTTLHLHARVNQGVHPLEASGRLMLDDIITTLEQGKPIESLYLAAGPYYCRYISDEIKALPGLKVTKVKNPFVMDTLTVKASHGQPFGKYETGPSDVPQATSTDHLDSQLGSRLSDHDLREIFDTQIKPRLFANVTPSDHPQAVILGGQPGSGKSTLANNLSKENSVHISGEELRRFHPDYMRLVLQDDKTRRAEIKEDLGAWVEMILDYAKAHSMNILMESTMRDSERLIRRMDALQAAGYTIDLRVMAVPERISRQSLLLRYERQKRTHGIGHYASPDNHAGAYDILPTALEKIEMGKFADHLALYRRNGELIYENQLQDGNWQHPIAAQSALEAERQRPAEPAEYQQQLKNQDELLALMSRPSRNASTEDINELIAVSNLIEGRTMPSHSTNIKIRAALNNTIQI